MKKTSRLIKISGSFIFTFIAFCYIDGDFFNNSLEKAMQLVVTLFIVMMWEVSEI